MIMAYVKPCRGGGASAPSRKVLLQVYPGNSLRASPPLNISPLASLSWGSTPRIPGKQNYKSAPDMFRAFRCLKPHNVFSREPLPNLFPASLSPPNPEESIIRNLPVRFSEGSATRTPITAYAEPCRKDAWRPRTRPCGLSVCFPYRIPNSIITNQPVRFSEGSTPSTNPSSAGL